MQDSNAIPAVSLAQAVELTGKSKSTIRRRKQELLEHGAKADSEGWSIPVPALIAVGLMGNTTPADTKRDTTTPSGVSRNDTQQMADLQAQLARLEERAKQQEQLISQLKDQLNDKEHAIKLLEAAPAQEHKRGLWSRLTGRG